MTQQLKEKLGTISAKQRLNATKAILSMFDCRTMKYSLFWFERTLAKMCMEEQAEFINFVLGREGVE